MSRKVFVQHADSSLPKGRLLSMCWPERFLLLACHRPILAGGGPSYSGRELLEPMALQPELDDDDCETSFWSTLWKCSTGFTNRYTCTGPNSDPDCDSQAVTIDCGTAYICSGDSTACQNGQCVLTGVSLCAGIPYLSNCGSHQSCQ